MKKILLLNFFLSCALIANAQWDTLITGTSATLKHGAFVSQDTGIVVGADATSNTGVARYTTDGGINWNNALFNSTLPAVNAVSFFSQTEGCMVCDSGKIFFSHDAGLTWNISATITSQNLTAVSYPTTSSVWVGGENGILFNTLDGGITWDTVNSGTSLNITDLYFVYANTGWVVGDGGYMGVTADGGMTWNYFPQPYFGFFQPRGFGYAGTTNMAYCVGENGLAIASTDAGLTWAPFYTSATGNMNSVRFGSDDAGVICGDDNFIYRTNNGGQWWWQDTVPGMSCDLNRVIWASPSVCYIVGTNGRVLKNNTDITTVDEQNILNISASLFPNPVTERFTISYQLPASSAVTISFFDMAGREILSPINSEEQNGPHAIQVSVVADLTPGIYFVKLRSSGGMVTLPFVKQ